MDNIFPVGSGGFINPEKLLGQMDIKKGAKIADFGCGHGYFVLPMAKMVGETGKIFAIDVLKEALEAVRSRLQMQKISNVETIRGNLEVAGGSKLEPGSCDMVILANILFQSQKKEQIVEEARRVLRPGGEVVIVDWLPEHPEFGPTEGWRIASQSLRALAEGRGFSFVKNFNTDKYHFGMVFKK